MSKKEKITEEQIQLFFQGKTKTQKELETVEKSLEDFVEKFGGQYFCVVVYPTEEVKKREKYKVSTGNHVRILPSRRGVPFDRALSAVFEWIEIEKARKSR